jgi:hypothetical protein
MVAQQKTLGAGSFTLTPALSRKRKEIIHPHLNPLPSRERKIKEAVFHREREIRVVIFLRRARSTFE